jgi:hypothetical protein
MRLVGCLLMISGWLLLIASLSLLATLGQRSVFAGAALLVEALGVGVLALHYRSIQRGPR